MFVGEDKSIESNPKKDFKFYPRTGKVVFDGEKTEKIEDEKEEKKVVKKDLSKKQ